LDQESIKTVIFHLVFENYVYFYLKIAGIGEVTSNKRIAVVIQ
jgi:hypothetical protein